MMSLKKKLYKKILKRQLKEWGLKLKYKINVIFNWMVKLKKHQFSKRIKKLKKNEVQNWHKNKNNI